jgi:death on curing protein
LSSLDSTASSLSLAQFRSCLSCNSRRAGVTRSTASREAAVGIKSDTVIPCRVLGSEPPVCDIGLLESALARPRASAFGADAYPDLNAKAAALLHSLARNHALVDGTKRLALASLIAFYGINGRRLTLTNNEAYDLIMGVAGGKLDDVEEIAARLAGATEPW